MPLRVICFRTQEDGDITHLVVSIKEVLPTFRAAQKIFATRGRETGDPAVGEPPAIAIAAHRTKTGTLWAVDHPNSRYHVIYGRWGPANLLENASPAKHDNHLILATLTAPVPPNYTRHEAQLDQGNTSPCRTLANQI